MNNAEFIEEAVRTKLIGMRLLVKIGLTLILTYCVYQETGIFTATALFLIAVATELQTMALRLLYVLVESIEKGL